MLKALKRTLVLDLDGVVADHSHRLDLARAGDWTAYEEAAVNDKVINEASSLLFRWQDSGGSVIILTSRSANKRDATWKWLNDNDALPDVLIMRPANTWMTDAELKIHLLDEYFEGRETALNSVCLVIDDTEANIAAFRNAGYVAWLAG